MKNNKNKFFFFISMAIVLVILDQITKIIILNHFGIENYGIGTRETIKFIGDFIQFQYVPNEGMAMGLTFLPQVVLGFFSLIASIALTYYLYKIKEYSIFVCLGISLILAGAVGNLIDRVFYDVIFADNGLFMGKVIDFIKVDIPDISIFGREYSYWPIFNIADSCVTVGVIVLLIVYKKIPSFTNVFPKKNALKEQNSQ